ncbi:MAG TPA: type II secretion system minor pseudopilin GspK [Candidatus Binataceae bacterium]|jgi:general secretion pathway protein K|nr:type II secretion system minor pseudopilin GspK [Candidatus Binataceae bacterium]
MVKSRLRLRRGVALMATMLAIALMTILVGDFTTSAALGYRSAANQADELKAHYLARSAVAVGLAILEQSSIANTPINNGTTGSSIHDSLDQPWAQPAAPVPIDGGYASVAIADEDRKLNVNLLLGNRGDIDPNMEPIFGRLIENLGLSPDLLPVLEDWLDADNVARDGGAEADFYLTLTPPYEPRNGPIPTVYDLRMLKGVDDAAFIKLSQCLTAVPTRQINVNTAPPEVLAALSPALENDPSVVQEIVARRLTAPYLSITDLKNEASLPNDPQFQSLLAVRSNFFTIIGEGDFAGARKRIYATFKRGEINPVTGAQFALVVWHED